MTNKNKPMSKDEWLLTFGKYLINAEVAFDAARQGMIPADRAIELDWEGIGKDADTANIIYQTWGRIVDNSTFIPRPTPAWTPKVGDAVFVDDTEDSGYILALKIHDIDKEGRCEMVDHFGTWWHRTHLKPFDSAKIGLSFDQI